MVEGARCGRAIAGRPVLWGRRGWKYIAVQGWFRVLARAAAQVFLDQVCRCEGDTLAVFERGFVNDHRSPVVLGALVAVRLGDEPGFTQVVFGLQVLDFGGVWAVQNAYWN